MSNPQQYAPPQGGGYPAQHQQHQQHGGYQQQIQYPSSHGGHAQHHHPQQQYSAPQQGGYYGQQQQQPQQQRAPQQDPLQQLQQHYAAYQQQTMSSNNAGYQPRGAYPPSAAPYGGAQAAGGAYGAGGSNAYGQQQSYNSSNRGGGGGYSSNYRGGGGRGGSYGGAPSGGYEGSRGGYGQSSYAPRDGGYAPRDGGYAPRDGGYAPRDGGYAPRDGGYAPRDGGYAPRDGGYAPRDGGRGVGRGGFEDRGGYRGGYRGGRGNGGGFGAGHFGGKELNFVIHVESFEALNLLGRSMDIFGAISNTAQQKIQKALRGADLEVHVLFLVEGRYLGGFSSRHSRQTIILPQALSSAYGDMREATTDQGAPLFGSTQDGDALPRHYYLSLKQIVQDIQGMVSAVSKKIVTQSDAAPANHSGEENGEEATTAAAAPVVEDLTPSNIEELLQLKPADATALIPQSLQTLELLLQVIAQAGSSGAAESAESAYVFQIIEHDPHFLFCTAGMKLLHELLSWENMRQKFFDVLETLTNAWTDEVVAVVAPAAESTEIAAAGDNAAASSSRNILESKGYGLFKQLLIHPFSGPLALQIFGLLPIELKTTGGQRRARTAVESTSEVRVFCKAFEIFGFEAVCGNLGGATLAALLGRFSEPTSSTSNGGNNNNYNARKRGREEDAAADAPAQESNQVLADRILLVRAAAVAFTAGIDVGNHEVRISALARHVLACRSVQCIIRGFLEVVVNDPASPLKPFTDMTAAEKISVAGRASTFVECMCRSAASLMVDNYGNYVMQTLATDSFGFMASASSSPRAAAFLMTLLKVLLQNVEGSFWDIATNKCGSNCIEKLVIATEKLTGSALPQSSGAAEIQTFGAEAIVSLSESLARLGPQAYGQLFVHAFGNYAVRQLLQRLTAISTRSENAALKARALFCEVTFYRTLYSMMPNMEGNMYATGVRSWFSQHSARLNAALTAATSGPAQ
jgi:hypothetical protein